ncbi:MAG: hypothetical protein ONB44_19550 [candidate division KSB1 bacterium]|nr:hypothetical protein [candidate division KSB1 bacterium]MDZ7304326.1 hypothetical protein [candidate division KSB1 bacterium]MDZ7313602.1 hypothetical protein [candidate division KSB1 bacterium]
MDMQIIPTADPIPLPAPFWLFKLLLLVTFLLHILVMNFMLGGGFLAAIAKLQSRKDENHRRLFEDLSRKIPSLLAATITLGVAPLLFLQVLYGQFFYSSSILIGWPWFLVLIFLTLAYYGFYLVAFKKGTATNTAGWVILFSLILVFVIGFFYSNNMTLMLTPEKWAAKYHADPSGWNLNWSEPTLIPRFLHFFVASIAVGGLFVASAGLLRWKQDTAYARFLIKLGGRWFMYATMLQIVIGLWFLISLPGEKMMLFMGKNLLATIALLIGIVGALAAIFLMSETLRKDDPRKGFYLVSGLTAVVIIFMVIMRDILRDAYLANYFSANNFLVQTQWDVLILFLVLFVGGVALWLVMIKRYFFSPKLRTEG